MLNHVLNYSEYVELCLAGVYPILKVLHIIKDASLAGSWNLLIISILLLKMVSHENLSFLVMSNSAWHESGLCDQ